MEPDLHSFMALLSAYAKTGDDAVFDARVGMRAREHPAGSVGVQRALGACAAAGASTPRRGRAEEMRPAARPRTTSRSRRSLATRARGRGRGFAEYSAYSPRMKSTRRRRLVGRLGRLERSPAATSVSARAALAGRSPSRKRSNREKGKADASSGSSSGSGSSSSSSSSPRGWFHRRRPVSSMRRRRRRRRRRRGRVCSPRRR